MRWALACTLSVAALCVGCGTSFDECARAGLSPDEVDLLRAVIVEDRNSGITFATELQTASSICSQGPYVGIDPGDCLVCVGSVIRDVYNSSGACATDADCDGNDRCIDNVCMAITTESEARNTCAGVGGSDEVFADGVGLAEEDKADGLSATDSKELFRGDCEDDCGGDSECFSDCFTCASAIVDYVYSSE